VAETATPDRSAINFGRLDSLRELVGDAEFRQLMRTFRDDLARRVTAMARLGAAGDISELGRVAHTLRGTAGSYGLDDVATLAERLETVCAVPGGGVPSALDALLTGMTASAATLTARLGLESPG
jgi:HPt (histidine-containing phosphotransfer) domain-containing protein